MTWKDEIKKEEINKYLSPKAKVAESKRLVADVYGLFDKIEKKEGLYTEEGRKLGVRYAIDFLARVEKMLGEVYDTMEFPPESEESEADKYDAEVMRRLREGGDYYEARANLGSRR